MASTVTGPRLDTPTRSDLLRIVWIRACLYGRGAYADFTLKTAALVKTNPTEWLMALTGPQLTHNRTRHGGNIAALQHSDVAPR